MNDDAPVPIKAHFCKVCGAPGVIHLDRGVTRQRLYCAPHWAEYTATAKRKREREKREAELDAATPPGWTRVGETGKSGLPDGVSRLRLDWKQGTTLLRRGIYKREATLKHPENWTALVRFYLNVGWRLVSERGGVLVLERHAAAERDGKA